MRLGYLYSRYPVLSQTFCDAEMLELERREHEIILRLALSAQDSVAP